MRYRISVKEVWYQEYGIDADSPEEAVQKVKDGDGVTIGDPEYSHVLEGSNSYIINSPDEE